MAEYDEIYQKLNGKLVQIVDKNYGDDNYLKLDVSNIGGKPEQTKSVVTIKLVNEWEVTSGYLEGVDPAIDPNSKSIILEKGGSATYTGHYYYTKNPSQEMPDTIRIEPSRAFGGPDKFPTAANTNSDVYTNTYTTNGSISVSVSKGFDGENLLFLENNYLKYETTSYTSTSSESASISFQMRKYLGESTKDSSSMTSDDIKSLSFSGSKKLYSDGSISMTVSFPSGSTTGMYFHYCYPKSWGEIKSVTGTGVITSIDSFIKREITIKNSMNQDVEMYLYTTTQKKPFPSNSSILISK
jgi:hypothetical protein